MCGNTFKFMSLLFRRSKPNILKIPVRSIPETDISQPTKPFIGVIRKSFLDQLDLDVGSEINKTTYIESFPDIITTALFRASCNSGAVFSMEQVHSEIAYQKLLSEHGFDPAHSTHTTPIYEGDGFSFKCVYYGREYGITLFSFFPKGTIGATIYRNLAAIKLLYGETGHANVVEHYMNMYGELLFLEASEENLRLIGIIETQYWMRTWAILTISLQKNDLLLQAMHTHSYKTTTMGMMVPQQTRFDFLSLMNDGVTVTERACIILRGGLKNAQQVLRSPDKIISSYTPENLMALANQLEKGIRGKFDNINELKNLQEQQQEYEGAVEKHTRQV